jgi:hypothetical protein
LAADYLYAVAGLWSGFDGAFDAKEFEVRIAMDVANAHAAINSPNVHVTRQPERSIHADGLDGVEVDGRYLGADT